jgi:serine/threonine protein kinase
MEKQYFNNEYAILKDKNTSQYKLQFPYYNKLLIDSIINTNLISGMTTTYECTFIKFTAFSLLPFKNVDINSLTVETILTIFYSLTQQLKYLLERKCSICAYSLENMVLINGKYMFFVDGTIIEPITDTDKSITITFPISKSKYYCSPELINVTSIPHKIHYKCVYFSLACVLMYLLTKNNQFYEYYMNHPLNYEVSTLLSNLDGIPVTDELRQILNNCFHKNPEKRAIIYI